ncbi:alkaline phosphatase [Elusimicrobium simillimum]|uniref:alkaline phosphatase n=1 Tax=Elusimicrobium simillimum TaxID=3143438 RepID=UPI003C6F8905
MKKIAAVLAVLFLVSGLAYAQEAKNIILIIVDGGGPQEFGFLAQYARYAPNSPYADKTSNLEKYFNKSNIGLTLTNTYATLVTDSAASGTQIATGHYTLPGAVGMDYDGKKVGSILEAAREAGKSTGLITTVYLQDATPSVFAAHQINRGLKDAIAKDMLNANVDVMLGGGAKHFRPLFNDFKTNGYAVAQTKEEFLNLPTEKGSKLLGVFAETELPYVIYKDNNVPTLKEMTEKALTLLSKNEKGFFLMAEAGKVDWVLHANDAASTLHELLEFDETLGYVMDWAAKRNDTLVVLTADHETGGFGFNYFKVKGEALEKAKASGEVLYDNNNTNYVHPTVFDALMQHKALYYHANDKFNSLPKKQKKEKMLAQIFSETTGQELPQYLYKGCKDIECVAKRYDKSLGIVWSTGAHSATPVAVAAYGPTQDSYNGLYHTTDLNKKMRASLGVK